jgi:c(7)-type cytochrome triheme protein
MNQSQQTSRPIKIVLFVIATVVAVLLLVSPFTETRAQMMEPAAAAVEPASSAILRVPPDEEEEEEEEDGGDLVFHVVSRSQPFSVLYSHEAHLEAGLECADCHDSIFKKEFNGNHFKMSDINKGKACGVCHNSSPAEGIEPAFPPRKNCERCHTLRIREPEKRKR